MYKQNFIQCRFTFNNKFDTVEPYQEAFYKLEFIKTDILHIFLNNIYQNKFKMTYTKNYSSKLFTNLWLYELTTISKQELLNMLNKL